METLMLPFSPRFIVLTICSVVTALLLGIGIVDHKVFDLVGIPIVIFGALTLLGIRDLTQKSHAVLRNYPISAHLRFLLEEIRPEMRQYFFESEKDGMPFSRDTRAVIYQRAKMVLDKRPFGTQEDVYREGYEWMHHSVAPKVHSGEKFRVTIGGPDCARPYSMSVFNISAMSFGALSANAIRALNKGAALGGFAQDIGPNPRQEIVVTLQRNGRVYIASQVAKTALGKIDACEAIWTAALKKSEDLRSAYQKSGAKNEKLFDDGTKAEDDGDKAYRACLVARTPQQAYYPALVKEAQELADRLAGK